MADHQPRLDGALAPLVPQVDVQVGTADRGLLELDQDLVRARRGDRHLFHPDAFGASRLTSAFIVCDMGVALLNIIGGSAPRLARHEGRNYTPGLRGGRSRGLSEHVWRKPASSSSPAPLLPRVANADHAPPSVGPVPVAVRATDWPEFRQHLGSGERQASWKK
jgi:hypothetical protein